MIHYFLWPKTIIFKTLSAQQQEQQLLVDLDLHYSTAGKSAQVSV